MHAENIIFYLLSTVILGSGLMAVTARRIFRAAVYLLLCLVGIAGLYFMLDYQFIGAVQVVVYVGGIVVLIIFSIFLTHESGDDMPKPELARAVFSALAVILGCAFTCMFVNEQVFVGSHKDLVEPTVRNIGRQMLSTTQHGYILPFEVVSMLLLAAMVGCIVIAIKSRPTV